MIWSVALLAFVTAERLFELYLAKRHTSRLLAKGAYEIAPGHYPLIVLLHSLWLAGLWWLAPDLPLKISWLTIFLILQALRLWVLASLGERWTTRIIIMPGKPLVSRGPYKFFSHPNYLVVVGEILVLPLCFGLTIYGVVFSVLNAAVLAIRIRAENKALAGWKDNPIE